MTGQPMSRWNGKRKTKKEKKYEEVKKKEEKERERGWHNLTLLGAGVEVPSFDETDLGHCAAF